MASFSAVAIWLFGIFAALPGPDEAEDPAARRERLGVVAVSIALEAADVDEAALIARTVWEESGRLRRDVHAGQRKGDKGRAVCLGQVHAQLLVPRREWRRLHGTDIDATRRCIAAVARLYRAVGARCDRNRDPPLIRDARRAAAYATGRSCRSDAWRGALPRARAAAEWRRSAPDLRVPCDRLRIGWRSCVVAYHDTQIIAPLRSPFRKRSRALCSHPATGYAADRDRRAPVSQNAA